MESGSAAPAPILCAKENKYGVLDGIQGLSAANLTGATRFSAYVVSSDSDDVLTTIRMIANARLQGHSEPPEWTRRRAIEVLVIQRGMSVDEVARMGGWKRPDVLRISKILNWGFKIRNAGGPELADNMIEAVWQHLVEESLGAASEPIVGFLSTIKAAKFSSSDAKPYISEFFQPITKLSKQHEVYVERLAQFKEQPEVQTRLHGRRGIVVRRDVTLQRTLKSAVTVLDEIIAKNDELPYIDEFFRLLKIIDKRLRSVSSNPSGHAARVPADMWGPDA